MPTRAESPLCATRRAVILAAGESKRTRPLTSHRPKPLIPLLGQPLLAHILDELYGLVERVTLVVGYRADDIRARFGASYRGMQLDYVLQREVNGTAGALKAAAGQLDEPFFLIYGDNLIARADLLAVCEQRYCLAGLPVEDARPFGVLDVHGDRVLRILEKPTDPPPGALANPGIYHFAADVLLALERIVPSPRGEYELTDLIELIAAEHSVGFRVCTGFWIPVGNPWEALAANLFLLQRRAGLRPSIAASAEVDSSVVIEGAVSIGAGARIAADVYIAGPTVIGPGAQVESGCLIKESVIGSGAQIGSGTTVTQSAVGAAVRIGEDCLVQYSWLDDGVILGNGAALPARLFPELRPVACTTGLLDNTALSTRGSIIAAGLSVAEGAVIEPGSMVM